MKYRARYMVVLGLAAYLTPGMAAGQDGCVTQQVYRLEYQTVYEQQEVTAFRLEYETVYDERQVTSYRPAWETQVQERRTIVRRPLIETAMRDEQYTQVEPVVTYRQQYVDQGTWVQQQVCKPGPIVNHLRWSPAACVANPLTGVTAYKPPSLVWVPEQAPPRVEVRRVWQPNVVAVQVPQTTYVQRVCTRKVPVTTYRLVDQEQVQQIPVQVCRMVPQVQIVRTPRTVAKQVPVKYVCQVPRTVVTRVPICPPVTVCPTATCPPVATTVVPAAPLVVPSAPAVVPATPLVVPQQGAVQQPGQPTPAQPQQQPPQQGAQGVSPADQPPQIPQGEAVRPEPIDEIGPTA